MLDTYGIISLRHTGTARHFDDAAYTLYTHEARFGGCACVSQPAQLVGAGFCVSEYSMSRHPECGVYILENTITSGFYIGSSVDIDARWCKHRRELIRGIHSNKRLQRVWNKYGANAFVFRVLEFTERADTLTVEQRYLDRFVGKRKCYNLAVSVANGNKGRKLSEEHRAKIGAANKIALTGKKLPVEVRRKMSEALKGHRTKPVDEATRQKMRDAKLGRPAPHNSYPRTEATKAKISATKQGVPWGEKRREVQLAKQKQVHCYGVQESLDLL